AHGPPRPGPSPARWGPCRPSITSRCGLDPVVGRPESAQLLRKYSGAGGSDLDESPASVADNHVSYDACHPFLVSLRQSTRIWLTRRTRSSASFFIATP